MIIWAGVIDVWTGRIIATTTNRSQKQGLAMRKLAQELNRLNAGPDYKGLGGYINGKIYYRFQSFEFNRFSFYSRDYHFTLKYLNNDNKADFVQLAQNAKVIVQREAKESRENYEKSELTKIEAFDIPEEYKAVLMAELFKEY